MLRSRGGSGDQALAQIALEHLAVGVAWQRVLEPMEGLRHLIVGQQVGAVARKVFVVNGAAENDKGVDAFAENRARLGDDGSLDDRRMVEQNVLHLRGEDLVSPRVDTALEAA